jgi:hypothetical protein
VEKIVGIYGEGGLNELTNRSEENMRPLRRVWLWVNLSVLEADFLRATVSFLCLSSLPSVSHWFIQSHNFSNLSILNMSNYPFLRAPYSPTVLLTHTSFLRTQIPFSFSRLLSLLSLFLYPEDGCSSFRWNVDTWCHIPQRIFFVIISLRTSHFTN